MQHQGVFHNNNMGKTKKMSVSSPENTRSNRTSNNSGRLETNNSPGHQYFGVPLMEILKRENAEVPHLVVKACLFIYEHGMDETGVFRVNGNVRVVESLKASFNRTGDADFEEMRDVTSVASLLKMFLRELPNGLISEKLTRAFIRAQITNSSQPQVQLEQFRLLLQQIPPPVYKTLKFLMTFLVLLTKSAANKMDPQALGIVFAPCLFRCAEGTISLQHHSCTNYILKCFIIHFDELFLAEGEESPNSPGFVLKYPMVRNRQAAQQPQSKVDVSSSKPVPPPRKRKTDGIVRESQSQPQSTGHDNAVSPVPALRKNVAELGSLSLPDVADNLSQLDDDLLDTNRSNSPFALESDHSEFSTAPSPRFPRACDEIIEIVINTSVDEILFGEKTTDAIKTPTPPPRQRRKQQTDVVENGYRMPTIKDRMMQMKENHMARRDDGSQVRKTPNQIGFQLFDDEEGSSEATKPSVTKCNEDNQASISTHVMANHGSSGTKANKDPPPVSVVSQTATKKPADDLFDLADNSNKTTLHHIQKSRPAGPKRRNPTRKLFQKEATESDDVDLNWTAKDVKDQPPQPRPFLAETQAVTKKPEVNYDAKPSMKFLSEREHVSPEKSIPLNTKPYVPPLDFSTLHEHGDGSDPIPAKQGYSISLQKANQCEDGETALLSPRTSKVRSRKIGHPNTDVPPSPPTDQTHIPSKPIIDDKANQVVKQLAKKIQGYKKHIKEFEEDFERRFGYRPSQIDKSKDLEVTRCMQELKKARKELRRVKTEIENERHATMPSPGGHPSPDSDAFSSDLTPSMKETLQSLLQSLEQKRAEVNRPEELSEMTIEEVVDEKLAVQKALLHFESIHGRPSTKEDKALMRPLYDRYRNIKRILSKPQSPRDKSTELQSVPEEQPLDFTPSTTNTSERDVVHVPTAEHADEQEDFMVTREFNFMCHDILPGAGASFPDPLTICDGSSQSLHHLSREELLKEQQKARAERKHLRNLLREYEDELYKQTGSKAQRKAQAPLQAEYKHVKERLKLLKALLSKYDSLYDN